MLAVKTQNVINTLKQYHVAFLEWFKQLPTYQKIITCVGALTGSLIARYVYCKVQRKIYNYPPGPIGLPFIGSALGWNPLLNRTWKETFPKYAKPNEGIMMLYFGFTPAVHIGEFS